MTDLVGFRAAKLGGGRLVCGMAKSCNLNLFSVLCRWILLCPGNWAVISHPAPRK